MRGVTWRGILGLFAVVCLLQFQAVAAQGIGDWKEPSEDETSSQSGPCWQRNDDDVIDPDDAGVTGRRAYESPLFGYTVDWKRGWALDEYFETPAISFPSDNQDALCLIWDDGELYGFLSIIGQSASRGGPDADVEEWTDPDYIEAQWQDWDVEVLIAADRRDRGSVVYSLVNEDGARHFLIFFSIELRGGDMIYITFSANEASFEDAFERVSEDIEIDGEPVFTLYNWDDIEDVL